MQNCILQIFSMLIDIEANSVKMPLLARWKETPTMKADTSGGTLGEALREAIQRSGRSLSQLSKMCGVGGGVVSRFVRKRRDLTLTSASLLTEKLGIRLTNLLDSEIRPEAPIECFQNRAEAPLKIKLSEAKDKIQILTTSMTPDGALHYLDSIKTAIEAAGRDLKVTILASHPENDFLAARAKQLNEDESGYRQKGRTALEFIADIFQHKPNCKLFTYRDFPIQIWYRVDTTIYINILAVARHTRENCVFGVPINLPGIKATFLDHFDKLLKDQGTEEYVPDTGQKSATQQTNAKKKSHR
jgi:transcriptional regulator with XRE-family HTH domain